MGSPSYMRSVDRNVVMRRIPVLHSNTNACNDEYKTEILYFVLKIIQFNNFGFRNSVIRGTRHLYSPNKCHIKLTIIYNSPAYNDRFLNRDTTTPYL